MLFGVVLLGFMAWSAHSTDPPGDAPVASWSAHIKGVWKVQTFAQFHIT
jgi:hypothetical protein